jgi:hypothetical protein
MPSASSNRRRSSARASTRPRWPRSKRGGSPRCRR